MRKHHKLKGMLKIDKNKLIECIVHLDVETVGYDDWENTENYKLDEFIDGVKATGELFFDTSPIDFRDKHPVRKSVTGCLSLTDGSKGEKEECLATNLNILLVEKTGESFIVDKKIKRYFWNFYVIGKPLWDKLQLFPKNYRGKKMNRVYACTAFDFACIVVAENKIEAKKTLMEKFTFYEEDLSIVEVDIQEKQCFDLVKDGNICHFS